MGIRAAIKCKECGGDGKTCMCQCLACGGKGHIRHSEWSSKKWILVAMGVIFLLMGIVWMTIGLLTLEILIGFVLFPLGLVFLCISTRYCWFGCQTSPTSSVFKQLSIDEEEIV